MKEIIYPYYEEIVGWNFRDEYPLDSIADLKYCIGINDILIDYIEGKEIAWTTYTFESILDNEHGLSLLFEGTKFLKHASANGIDYESILSRSEYEKYVEDINQDVDSKSLELIQTQELFISLIEGNSTQELKQIINQPNFDINFYYPTWGHTLIEEVVRRGKLDFAKWMYQKGANVEYLLHQGNLYAENTSRIEFIKLINGNLNEVDKNGKTLSDKYLDIASREFTINKPSQLNLYKNHLMLLVKYKAKLNIEERHIDAIEQMRLFE